MHQTAVSFVAGAVSSKGGGATDGFGACFRASACRRRPGRRILDEAASFSTLQLTGWTGLARSWGGESTEHLSSPGKPCGIGKRRWLTR